MRSHHGWSNTAFAPEAWTAWHCMHAANQDRRRPMYSDGLGHMHLRHVVAGEVTHRFTHHDLGVPQGTIPAMDTFAHFTEDDGDDLVRNERFTRDHDIHATRMTRIGESRTSIGGHEDHHPGMDAMKEAFSTLFYGGIGLRGSDLVGAAVESPSPVSLNRSSFVLDLRRSGGNILPKELEEVVVKTIVFLERIRRQYHAEMVINSLKYSNFAMERKERVRNSIRATIMTGTESVRIAF